MWRHIIQSVSTLLSGASPRAIVLASPHIPWGWLTNRGGLIQQWAATTSVVPYTEEVAESVVGKLLQIASNDTLLRQVTADVWSWLIKRPSLPPGICWGRDLETCARTIETIRALNDVEILKSYLLLLWSEWDGAPPSSFDNMPLQQTFVTHDITLSCPFNSRNGTPGSHPPFIPIILPSPLPSGIPSTSSCPSNSSDSTSSFRSSNISYTTSSPRTPNIPGSMLSRRSSDSSDDVSSSHLHNIDIAPRRRPSSISNGTVSYSSDSFDSTSISHSPGSFDSTSIFHSSDIINITPSLHPPGVTSSLPDSMLNHRSSDNSDSTSSLHPLDTNIVSCGFCIMRISIQEDFGGIWMGHHRADLIHHLDHVLGQLDRGLEYLKKSDPKLNEGDLQRRKDRYRILRETLQETNVKAIIRTPHSMIVPLFILTPTLDAHRISHSIYVCPPSSMSVVS